MKKEVQSIREMEKIEGVIRSSQMGVLAFSINDNLKQIASPFIYLDKNFYFIFDSLSEKEIRSEDALDVCFIMQKEKGVQDSKFLFTEVICSGTMKKLDDKKKLNDICSEYENKYSFCENTDDIEASFDENRINIMMIDTEEFQASEISIG